MKVVLLKNNAPVSNGDFDGYLTEMGFHGRSALGVVTPAGVFRPITESVIESECPGHPRAYSILPDFRDFVEDLLKEGIVGRHIPENPRRSGSRSTF